MIDLIGTTINQIGISDDKTKLLFKTDQGYVGYYTEGDCCSVSWIEHFDGVEILLGATVLSVEDIDLSMRPDPNPEDHDSLTIYGYKLVTNKGEAILDFRNDSNGYYGGMLVRQAISDGEVEPLTQSF